MKLMLVSRVVSQQRSGGMPHVASDRAAALADAGHEVHLVTTSEGPSAGAIREYRCISLQPNLSLHYLPVKAHEWSLDFGTHCRKLAHKLRPDVVHLDSFDRADSWWLSLPDSVSKLAVTMHGFGWGAFLTEWNLQRLGKRRGPLAVDFLALRNEAKSLSRFSTVIGVSKHEYRMLRDEYGLQQAKLVYNPIPSFFFTMSKLPNAERTTFLCAAVSQGETRGFEVAKAAAAIAGVELKVVSHTPRHDMPYAYDKSIAIVLPTAFAQGFDLAVCEARARGIPAVMSATGSYLAEARSWDKLVETHDEKSLAKALIQMKELAPAVPYDDDAVIRHQPTEHASAWLNAIS